MDYFLIGLAIVLVIAIVFFRTPTGKGIWGEFQVKFILGKNKQDQKYVITI